jgi:hypothetical protein
MAEVTWFSARKKTEPQSLLKFALPYEFSSHEEFDSWYHPVPLMHILLAILQLIYFFHGLEAVLLFISYGAKITY